MENDWYVLQTKPHQEDSVRERLATLQVESFLPKMTVRVRAGRHLQRRVAPMFPSYLFVRADGRLQGKSIRYTPGVRDFLRSDGSPHPVLSTIVESLQTRIGPSGIYDTPPKRYPPGARLRIEDGPLRGLDVIFERELAGCERVAVLLAAMNFPARVILSPRLLGS